MTPPVQPPTKAACTTRRSTLSLRRACISRRIGTCRVNLAIRTFVFLFMGIAGRNVSPVSFREALRASGVVSEMTFAVRGILLCRKAEEKAIPLEKREKTPARKPSEGGLPLFKARNGLKKEKEA